MNPAGLRDRGPWAAADPWVRMPLAPLVRLGRVLTLWSGTPYMDGQSKCRVAADCTGLLSGVLGDLYGTRIVLPSAPRDSGVHGRAVVDDVVLALRRQVPSALVSDGLICAGDVVLTKAEFGAPGGRENHVAIAGLDRGVVLHARSPRAVFSPLCALPEIMAVYRLQEVERWC